jgi:hypothetical protein
MLNRTVETIVRMIMLLQLFNAQGDVNATVTSLKQMHEICCGRL